jgi:hypothetical protein
MAPTQQIRTPTAAARVTVRKSRRVSIRCRSRTTTDVDRAIGIGVTQRAGYPGRARYRKVLLSIWVGALTGYYLWR